MAYGTNWLHNRIALGTAALLAGAALAVGGTALAPTNASADDTAPMTVSAENGTVEVSVGGAFNTSSAEGAIDRINGIRSDADAPSLSWSTGLEATAQQRAVECALAGANESASNNEIVAVGSDINKLLENWVGQKNAYDGGENDSGTAEYALLVSTDFTAIGMASYTATNGTTYVVIELGTDASTSGTVASDGSPATVAVSTSDLSVQIDAPASLETGATGSASYTLAYNGSTVTTSSTPTWSSDNPNVMSIDAAGGTLTALAEGSATISLSVDGVVVGGVTVNVVAPTALTAVLPDGSTDLNTGYGVDPTPSLPQTASVTWSNGTTTEEPVTWSTIDSSNYSTPNSTFSVEGTAAGVPVSANVTVGPLYIVDVAQPADVVTEQGVPGELPATVTATMADGSTSETPVSWNEVDPSAWTSDTGSFDVTGQVEGWDQPITVHVVLNAPVSESDSLPEPDLTTNPVPETSLGSNGTAGIITGEPQGDDGVEKAPASPQGAAPVSVTTQAGTAPELPATVEVSYDDGTSEQVAVTWDEVDPASYAEPGSFTVEGSLEGIDGLRAEASVTVEALSITDIATTSVETVAGTAPSLPKTVKVTWSDGSTTEESVVWDAVDPANYAKAGSFVVSGTVKGTAELKATCTVNVTAPAAPQSVDTPANINTEAGTAPVLPTTVTVHYSDGSTQQHKVTWETVDSSSYHNGGSFTVKGTVDGTSLTTQVTVVVANAKVTGIQNNLAVQTRLGVAPTLPETASVRWSNGDVTNEKVTWNAIDPGLYRKVGTFTVNGTVVGYSVPCTVTVVDQVVQTGDETNMVPVAIGAVAGVAIVAAAIALIVRNRRKRS